MSLSREQAEKLSEDPVLNVKSKQDPMSMINGQLLQWNVNFDPLREVLHSLLDFQKMCKIRLDEVTAENAHIKSTIREYDENFVYLESKFGKANGKQVSSLSLILIL